MAKIGNINILTASIVLTLLLLHVGCANCLYNEIASIIDMIMKQFKPPEFGCRNTTVMTNFDINQVLLKGLKEPKMCY